MVWDAVRALLEDSGEQQVLDIGGGTGGFAVRVAGRGNQITVIDPSPDALAALARRADEEGVADRVTGLQGDLGNLRELAPEGGADLVLCHGVLGLVDDPATALHAIASVLRPGGALSMLVSQRHAAVLARAMAGHFTQAMRLLDDEPTEHRSSGEHRPASTGSPPRSSPLCSREPGSTSAAATASAFSPTWCPPRCSTSSQAPAQPCSSWSGRSPNDLSTSPSPASCTSSPPTRLLGPRSGAPPGGATPDGPRKRAAIWPPLCGGTLRDAQPPLRTLHPAQTASMPLRGDPQFLAPGGQSHPRSPRRPAAQRRPAWVPLARPVRSVRRGARASPMADRSHDCPILHVDMDAFYASVAIRDRPELAEVPVIVGGGHRGVVLAANYPARRYGVHSALPMTRARRLCPDAVVLSPDYTDFEGVSSSVMEIFRQVTPMVEAVSMDEAFLDVSGAIRRLGSPLRIAEHLRARVADEQRITCSVGVAGSVSVAKLASRRAKPDGVIVVPPREVTRFLHPLDVGELYGVGEKTGEQLHRLGLRTVGDVAHTPLTTLQRGIGVAVGTQLHHLAWGTDRRALTPAPGHPGSRQEHGCRRDLRPRHRRPAVVLRELLRLSAKVTRRMRRPGWPDARSR